MLIDILDDTRCLEYKSGLSPVGVPKLDYAILKS